MRRSERHRNASMSATPGGSSSCSACERKVGRSRLSRGAGSDRPRPQPSAGDLQSRRLRRTSPACPCLRQSGPRRASRREARRGTALARHIARSCHMSPNRIAAVSDVLHALAWIAAERRRTSARRQASRLVDQAGCHGRGPSNRLQATVRLLRFTGGVPTPRPSGASSVTDPGGDRPRAARDPRPAARLDRPPRCHGTPDLRPRRPARHGCPRPHPRDLPRLRRLI